jgi:hypothetical protein
LTAPGRNAILGIHAEDHEPADDQAGLDNAIPTCNVKIIGPEWTPSGERPLIVEKVNRSAFLNSYQAEARIAAINLSDRDVTKTNTSQVETFRSLEFGALGVVDVEAVRFYRSPLRRQTLTADSRTAFRRVEIVTTLCRR